MCITLLIDEAPKNILYKESYISTIYHWAHHHYGVLVEWVDPGLWS